jgi:SHAQKYF class myb-like DNA-binding protein
MSKDAHPNEDPSDVDEGEDDNVSPNNNTHPVPPPFNPIGPREHLPVAILSSSAAEAAVLAAKGASVVPDLMRVYESLTQSSTPQQNELTYMDAPDTADEEAQAQAQYSVYHPYDMRPDQQEQQQQQQQQQHPIDPQFGVNSYAQAWTYDTTSVPVAPHYAEHPYAPSTMPVPANVNVHPNAPVVPSSSASSAAPIETGSPNNGARSLRKRTAAASFANNNNNNNNGNNSNSNNSNNNSNRDDSSSASIGDNTSTTPRGGSKAQRRSKGAGKDSDGRWSKRFTWPEDLHRDFVSAVFDVGLKHSSPSTILEHMPKHEQITSERIKSHLQKYRLHRAKSKKEFMASYESAVTKIQTEGLASVTSLGGAQVPAHLTYVTMTEASGGCIDGVTKQGQGQGQPQQLQQQVQQPPQLQPPLPVPPQGAQAPATTTDEPKTTATQQQQEALMLPRLSEAEKASPIGASMGYLMGLFFSLKQQLVAQRAAAAAAAATDAANMNQPVAAVFDAFVSGNLPSTGDLVAVNPDGTPTLDKGPPNAVPSARSNLEENNMMKREMKNQMAFQNKMRALKMQELKKLKTVGGDEVNGINKEGDGSVLHLANAVSTAAAITANSKAVAFDSTTEQHQHHDPDQLQPHPLQQLSSQQHLHDDDQQPQDFQGAGEAAADGGGVMFEGERNRSMSIGASEDFWNTDVVDDQLFEFLMNN